MRLRLPTVQYVESEDGFCSITYEGLDEAPAQAGGGAMYLLRISQQGSAVEVRGTVQSTTGQKAEEQARVEGIDTGTMSLADMRKYRETFSEKHGRSACVVSFAHAGDLKGRPMERIANEAHISQVFCKMFLRITAEYKYNNSEYPKCGDGYYLHSVEYNPWGVDTAMIGPFTAEWAFNERP